MKSKMRFSPRQEWVLTIAMWIMVLVIAFSPVVAAAGIFSRSPQPEPQAKKEGFAESVSSGVSGAAESISNMASRVQHTITDPFRSDPSKQFLSDTEKAIQDLEDLTSEKTNELLEQAKAIKDKYKDLNQDSWTDEAKRKAKEFERRLRWRTSSLQSLKDSFGYTTDYVQDFFDDLKESAKDTWQDAKSWAQDKAETGKEYAESGKDYMQEQANRLAGSFPDLLRVGKEELSRRLSQENLEATWDEAEENMELAAQSVWDSDLSIEARTRMQDLLNNGSAFARGVYSDAREMFLRAKQEGRNRQESMSDTASQLRDFLEDQSRQSKSTIRKMGAKLFGQDDEACAEVKQQYDSVVDMVRNMLEHLDPTTRARCIDEGVLDFAKRKTLEAKDAVVDTAAQAKDTVIDAKDTVMDAKDTIADKATQAKESVMGAKDTISNKATQAKESIIGAKDTVADTASQAKDSVVNAKDRFADSAQRTKERAENSMEAGKLRLEKLKQRAAETMNV
eukprot:m.31517 g.31517  ORF g.31517 m.31517 type:complete len:507 (+) comp10692_c1_seq1:301-1821(+)